MRPALVVVSKAKPAAWNRPGSPHIRHQA